MDIDLDKTVDKNVESFVVPLVEDIEVSGD
jgi:hypothetical protein